MPELLTNQPINGSHVTGHMTFPSHDLDGKLHKKLSRVGLETPKACKKVLLTYGTKTPCKKLVLLTVNNRSRDLKKIT